METRHVKINYDEGINSKREILNAQMKLINMQKAICSYSELKKGEFVLKTAVKSKLSNIINKLNSFKKEMPKVEEKKEIKEQIKEVRKPKEQSLEHELNEIKKKLEKLG